MTSSTVREAWAGKQLRLGSPADWARDASFAAVAGLWVGALGPFGNYHAGPLEVRLTFHLALMATNLVALGLAIRLAIWGGRQIGITPWISAPAAIVITCLPLSAIASWLGVALFPHLRHVLSPFDWYFETLLLLLPLGSGYVGTVFLLDGGRAVATTDSPPVAVTAPLSETQPRLADRLQTSLSGEILALNAEDHYVRIHTGSGSQLVLMRLSDAIAEMDGIEGLRTHRSWWVSRRAVGTLDLSGRGGRLVLRSGLHVPIARSALIRLRNSDWHRTAAPGEDSQPYNLGDLQGLGARKT